MRSDDPSFTDPAMEVIRRVDPGTYARLAGSDVPVHVIRTGGESAMQELDPYTMMLFMNSADGLTTHTNPAEIFLNVGGIRNDARGMHVPVAELTASTLVHEGQHAEDITRAGKSSEHSGFAAELAFDRRLGNARITAGTEKTAPEEEEMYGE